MSEAFRERARELVERLGYVAHRWPTNRFEGMRHALQLLDARGYTPGVIIDCGANIGQWMETATSVFPEAIYHAIEPQPKCARELERLKPTRPRLVVHATAVTEPGVTSVRMIGSGDGTGTGNFVALADETLDDEVTIAATTLDALLDHQVNRSHRALLKLDVERHEISVLQGATRLLANVEVVLSETGVYDVSGGRPIFADLIAFMRERGFDFYDVACLSSRPRDHRLRQMDVMFVRNDSPLVTEHEWA
jgi:FkbM family methyltransferase